MTVHFMRFSKKRNSTKIPTQQGTTLSDVRFKNPCSVMNPVLQLPYDYDQYNYMWYYDTCRAITRYYFLVDAVHINNEIVECTYTEDVMATWHGSIGTQTEYITRTSDANYVNELLNDTISPAENATRLTAYKLPNVYNLSGGFYCIGLSCVSTETGAVNGALSFPVATRGSVQYVLMTQSDLIHLIQMLANATWTNATFSPFQYLVSCVYMPFTPQGAMVDVQESIKLNLFNLGSFKLHYHAYSEWQVTSGTAVEYNHSIDINEHYMASTRGKYLNYAPWRKGTIYTGGFGNIPMPFDKINDTYQNALTFRVLVDYPTGMGKLRIYSGKGNMLNLVYENVAQIGIPIQLSQKTTADIGSVLNTVSSVVGAVASGAVGNAVGAIGGTVSAISSAVDTITPHVSTSGSVGTYANIADREIYIEVEEFTPVEHNSDKGKPCCQSVKIQNIATGSYVQCADYHAEFTCNDAERTIIETTCNNGFFWEG